MLRLWRATTTRSTRGHQSSTTHRCLHGDSGHPTRPSRHAQFYSDLLPAMIPVALLGSAVYMVRELYPLCDFFFQTRSKPDLCNLGSSRVYSCCRLVCHMKNTLTRRGLASRSWSGRSMLSYLREEAHPHPQSSLRTPRMQQTGLGGLRVDNNEKNWARSMPHYSSDC
jgi:hypothetical protein